MSEIDGQIAEIGCRAFVRQTMITTLKECIDKKISPTETLRLINKRILEEFTKIAKDETSKVFAELQNKLNQINNSKKE